MLTRRAPAGLPIGVPSYLLVSLANLGPKMFNVTKINPNPNPNPYPLTLTLNLTR